MPFGGSDGDDDARDPRSSDRSPPAQAKGERLARPSTGPSTLTSSTRRISATGCSASGPPSPMPALLTRPFSVRPPSSARAPGRRRRPTAAARGVGDIDDQRVDLVAKLAAQRGRVSLLAHGGEDAPALAGENLDRRAADAGRGAGDDCVHRHGLPFAGCGAPIAGQSAAPPSICPIAGSRGNLHAAPAQGSVLPSQLQKAAGGKPDGWGVARRRECWKACATVG